METLDPCLYNILNEADLIPEKLKSYLRHQVFTNPTNSPVLSQQFAEGSIETSDNPESYHVEIKEKDKQHTFDVDKLTATVDYFITAPYGKYHYRYIDGKKCYDSRCNYDENTAEINESNQGLINELLSDDEIIVGHAFKTKSAYHRETKLGRGILREGFDGAVEGVRYHMMFCPNAKNINDMISLALDGGEANIKAYFGWGDEDEVSIEDFMERYPENTLEEIKAKIEILLNHGITIDVPDVLKPAGYGGK